MTLCTGWRNVQHLMPACRYKELREAVLYVAHQLPGTENLTDKELNSHLDVVAALHHQISGCCLSSRTGAMAPCSSTVATGLRVAPPPSFSVLDSRRKDRAARLVSAQQRLHSTLDQPSMAVADLASVSAPLKKPRVGCDARPPDKLDLAIERALLAGATPKDIIAEEQFTTAAVGAPSVPVEDVDEYVLTDEQVRAKKALLESLS